MKANYGWITGLVIVGALSAVQCFASEESGRSATEISNRQGNKIGFYLGVGEPAPTLVGMNAAYNVSDFMRLTAGFGKVTTGASIDLNGSSLAVSESTATTLGVGAKFLMPGWNLSPILGLGFNHVSYSGQGMMISGFTESGSHISANLGVDWQAKSGFNAGAGYQMSFKSGVGSGLYLTAGWFFDWLS